ncbi:MAG: hypothetical protein ACRDZ2_05510 [Ilumatobacteraceae bacterium]
MRKFIIPTVLGAAGVVGVVAVTAGAASAQEDPEPPKPRAEFVCENLEQIQALQADHATLIADRLVLLGEARATAEAGGNSEAVERIDRRTARITERQGKVADRQEQLTAFATEKC